MDSMRTCSRKFKLLQEQILYCDVGLLGYACPENINEIFNMAKLGVFGFKGYLLPPPGIS
jgi:hypothetical protein